MELSCSRCHQTVQDGYCYCPTCGLPQIIYSAESSGDAGQNERWGEAVRDANTVDWKSALRSALPLAILAGFFCAMLSPVGMLLMAATAAWAVTLYTRSQRPSWITIGAGARIGLVTGVIGGWTFAAVSGLSLYVMRFGLHQGSVFDNKWQDVVNRWQEQVSTPGADAQSVATFKALMISQEGRAGFALLGIALLMATLVLFAVAGGALSARLLTRTRRPGN